MDRGQNTNKTIIANYKPPFTIDWSPYKNRHWTEPADTAVPMKKLQSLAQKATTVPPGLQAAFARREGDCRPPRDGRGRTAARLGHGRDARLRVAHRPGLWRAPVGRGRRPRHVLAPSRRAARPEPRKVGRRHVDPAAAREARPARVRGHRLGAHRERGRGLRIRLFDVGSDAPRDLGGAVRRFRQRRAGRHRPVHQRRRSEVGQDLRTRHAAAPRLRRAGTGALVRASRALPPALRAAQHAGVRADHARAGLPHAASANAPQISQAAHRDEPEEPAAGTRRRCLRSTTWPTAASAT